MINGDIKAFLDMLYTGQELVFKFDNKKYFAQGWFRDGVYHLECWNYADSTDDFSWEHDSKSQADNADAFLKAPLWDGKPFMEVEESVEWLDE